MKNRMAGRSGEWAASTTKTKGAALLILVGRNSNTQNVTGDLTTVSNPVIPNPTQTNPNQDLSDQDGVSSKTLDEKLRHAFSPCISRVKRASIYTSLAVTTS